MRFSIATVLILLAGWTGATAGEPAACSARANHFELTLSRLLDFDGDELRGIVRALNTHVGDARATWMHNMFRHCCPTGTTGLSLSRNRLL